MPHYHNLPPAVLTKAEWEQLKDLLYAAGFSRAFELIQKGNNKPQKAEKLFEAEDVRSSGRDRINAALRRSEMGLVLARTNYLGGAVPVAREKHLLVLVRKPKEK